MDGSADLLQLAHLLQVSATVARDIARLRSRDAEAIDRLAEEADALAEELTRIAQGPLPAG